MISHDQFAKALTRHRIVLSNLQINALLTDLLPNPQSGFSCDGATVWGDSRSIDKVKRWNHDAGNIDYYANQLRQEREQHASSVKAWRTQHDAQQARAMRSEELGIQMLAFIQQVAGSNPASSVLSATAHQFLEDRHIEPVEGFFTTQDAALADAREKFYAAAHPKRTP